MTETIYGVTKPFSIGNPDSIVLVVPKEVRKKVNVKPGTLWHVKVDEKSRIIYEPIEKPVKKESQNNEH